MDYRKAAQGVLDNIGGKDNIASAAHCATRLRLVIADNSKVDKAKIEDVEGVKGCFEASGQLQVIFGTGIVNKVYDEFVDLAGIESGSKDDVKAAAAKKQNIFFRAIKTLGDIFVPIIPAIVASGLLNGILGGLGNAFPSITDNGFYEIFNMFSGAALAMLPILIAISAAKKFGGNQFLAAVIGFIMIHPSLINAWDVASMRDAGEVIPSWDVWFGLINIEQVGYQGSVIPVLIAIFIMSWIEKKLHKWVPAVLDLFVTPLVTVIVTGYLTLTIIGPVFDWVEDWVVIGAQNLIGLPFGIGGILVGGLYAITVVAGLHHMYNMIEAQMCSLATPMNSWMPIATAANVGQGAAALAVGVKTKNKKIKSMAIPASMSAFLGITEPAIFGVNIRFLKPFIAGCIGGAAGGFVAAISGVYASAYGVTGLFGYLITTDFVIAYSLVMAVSFAVAFIISWILYKDDPEELAKKQAKEEAEAAEEANAVDAEATVVDAEATTEASAIEIVNPMEGEVKALSEVPDDTFAAGILGQGVGIVPANGNVYAPADGEITTIFPTKHAIGITTTDGAELLIHMGLNTVELDGKFFETKVNEGDKVKAGDLITVWDIEGVKGAGYETITPVLVTNSDDYAEVKANTGAMKVGQVIVTANK